MKNLCTLLLIPCALALAGAVSPASNEASKPTFSFHSHRQPGSTDHVVVRLEAGGQAKFSDSGKAQQEKMSVDCQLDYLEKTLDAPAPADATLRSVRDYRKAAAVVSVGDGQFRPALQPGHRLIAVEVAKQASLLFSPEGNLTRDELDVIDIQANSLLVDRMLPEGPVAVGSRWPHAAGLLAALLGLDDVSKTTVESTLKEVTDIVARFEFSGRVEGTIYGVSSSIEIKGKYRFDRRSHRIDWLALLVKEDRPASFVSDGVDAVSRLQMIIAPAEESAPLSDAALAKLELAPTAKRLCLSYPSPAGDWQCLYDRRWYVHHQRPKNPAAVLRLLDRGTLAGQCNLASLPRCAPEQVVSLEGFQEDVQRALGKNFGQFVAAGQSSNDDHYRIYRVVAEGSASEIPMRWLYYLVADPQGRQAAFTFTVEQKGIERFADADKILVQSLRFAEEKPQK
jgi:hypothetical protein